MTNTLILDLIVTAIAIFGYLTSLYSINYYARATNARFLDVYREMFIDTYSDLMTLAYLTLSYSSALFLAIWFRLDISLYVFIGMGVIWAVTPFIQDVGHFLQRLLRLQ